MALNKTTTNTLADSAITSDKIEDGAITNAKISDATTISITKTPIGALPPTITSLDTSVIDPTTGATITITGTRFVSIPDVRFLNTTTGARITASSVGFTSSTTITATFPSGQTAGVYKVIVENPNGLSVISSATITYSIAPAWSTAAGSLGSFEEGNSVNVSLLAYDDDSTAVSSYSLVSGSLPSGITLSGDSSIGALTGTAPSVDADTQYSFTIRATDNESQTSDRAFTMDITNWEVSYSTNLGDNAYYSRTPASAGNRRTFTFSFWAKRSRLGYEQYLYCTSPSNAQTQIIFSGQDYFGFDHYTTGYETSVRSTQVFRDPSAWYHFVVAVDTTQATASNRVKLYVNGSQITDLSASTYPSQNYEYSVNNTVVQNIGRWIPGPDNYYSGYLSEYCLIDGQQLTPSSFGETDATSGIWVPKKISGLNFGTNGFYLNFATRATDPIDASGNGNNWSSSNVLSTDWKTDTPMNNFATLNALDNSSVTLSEGNLSASCASPSGVRSTFGVTTSKWYMEVKYQSTTSMCGVVAMEQAVTTQAIGATIFGQSGGSAPELFLNGSFNSAYNSAGAFSANDIMQIALDMDTNTVYFGKNGSWFGGTSWTESTPTTGHTLTSGYTYGVRASTGSGTSVNIWNFGNPPFTISSGNADANGYGNFEYAVPSGYYALCTKNLAQYG